MKLRAAAAGLTISMATLLSVAPAQTPSAEDQQIDQIRLLSNLSPLDHERIRDWVSKQVRELAAQPPPAGQPINAPAFKAFRERFVQQYRNTSNTATFRTQFAAQTAKVAETELVRPELSLTVAASLARVLRDLNSVETVPGLLAGLRSPHQAARYFSAAALVKLKSEIAKDKARQDAVVAGLQAAGVVEAIPDVVGRIYDALAYSQQAAGVFDAYIAIFDARLAAHRSAPRPMDGADYTALEFFRSQEALNALSAEQKQELVRRLAPMMRIAAQRYNDPAIAPPEDKTKPDNGYYEREWIEVCLDANEDILEKILGQGKGGAIRDQFFQGGFENRAQVLQEAYRWVGDPQAQTPGAVNAPPWNVPIGAP